MQHPPSLKLSDDAGIRHGRLKDLKYATVEAIDDSAPLGQDSKQARDGFSPKNYVTFPDENRDVAALRKQAGWRTRGSVDREDPPTPKREEARPVTPLKKLKGSYCSEWGGGIDQSDNYI
jgi:hypothetical protein